MFQKFLIDNAIKIITTICGLLISAGIWLGVNQGTISELKGKIEKQQITIDSQQSFIQKDLSVQLARHEWFCFDFQNRIIYLERENKK